MWAHFNFEKLSAETGANAVKEGQSLIEKAEYDYDHAGYIGSFAECTGVILVGEPILADSSAAERWLDENAEKWGPMLIVCDEDGAFYAGARCLS